MPCPKYDDYYETPPELFTELDKEFDFQWDVCATPENTKVPGCFFTEEDNALEQTWIKTAERVWCNPPYSRPLKDQFLAKCFEHMINGGLAVALVPAKTDTLFFHSHIYNQTGITIRFLRGRPRFYLNGKPTKNTGRSPLMIVIFDGRAKNEKS